jgi:phosphoribosylformylglycinamidine synthase II
VQRIFTSDLYFLERPLGDAELARLGEDLLGNPLVNRFDFGLDLDPLSAAPALDFGADSAVDTVDVFVPDEELDRLSKEMVLSLSRDEWHALQAHYRDPGVLTDRSARGLPALPTDCELETIAQTWSEHCKHKEFNAVITHTDREAGTTEVIDSLFDTFVRAATRRVAESLQAAGADWLVKVFSDNAGVVRIDDDRLFVFKVETHNTPSALDPYGGAITGILGNNRDPLGTGKGGGRLLFNTNVLCFGPPDYSRPLLTGQLHPQRVFAGVRRGIEDGGNKSGVPTVNGAIVFDDRYAGKPLVYCGTGSVMPAAYRGRPSWEKEISPGDLVLMAGGRVGKDGIHGATFSSVEIDRHSPRQAVQIGSPITQKLVADFMEVACAERLISSATDCGAGGLASSVGELAQISGGARVQLAAVPLKYAGLRPWEIFLSEAQERMTLVVAPEHQARVAELAARYEVELTEIGAFTDSGDLEVFFGDRPVACLNLEFLHQGVPRKHLDAEWVRPALTEPDLPPDLEAGDVLLRLLGTADICSREAVIRQYDHEVKGKTVVKPLMGPDGVAPQDAAVMRVDFDGHRGIAVACGIAPRYGDLDAYHSSAGAFDEAVRQIIAVGGRLPEPAAGDRTFWSACDNFCLPDSAYHPEANPDGRYKLAQLVRMCRALYDVATAYGVPLTSGKDSMKNDFVADGEKISVPPTVLYSMVAAVEDVRRTVTTDFKQAGDLIYQVGPTYDELGGSAFYRLLGQLGANVPQVRPEVAAARYRRLSAATGRGLVASGHDLSDGGLAVALAECCFGGGLGARLALSPEVLAPEARSSARARLAVLFAESHSRFVVSIDPARRADFEAALGEEAVLVGEVTADSRLTIAWEGEPVLDLEVGDLLTVWQGGLPV